MGKYLGKKGLTEFSQGTKEDEGGANDRNWSNTTCFSLLFSVQFSSVAQSCLTLWLQGLQYARPPCSSPTPGVHSNSNPLSRWCHPTIQPSHPLHFYFRFLIEVIGNQSRIAVMLLCFIFFLSFNISTSPSLIFNFLGSGDRSVRKQTSIFLVMAYWNKNL